MSFVSRLATWGLLLSMANCANVLPAVEIGNVAPDFTLSTHRGVPVSLSDLKDKKVVVVVFMGIECPLAKLYGPRLQSLQDKFDDSGVAILGINSNTQDSMSEIGAFVAKHGIVFPMLKDVGNRVADAFHAERTPEVFVLDQQRVVRYHGRIDDQYGVGVARDKPVREDLVIAIEDLLAGRTLAIPQTPAVGCHIGRVSRLEPIGDITYTSHIARIFNRRCVECHRQGELAPFALTQYADVIGWEDTILEVIGNHRMPPWNANPSHGKFANDARLTDEERDLIVRWVENGMPEGDADDLPAPPQFVSGWRIPEPDQTFFMRETPFDVPAEGVVDYKHFVVETGWTEDKYIQAAEARPGNPAVVHHILVYIIGENTRRAELRKTLVGYAPGSTPIRLSDGTAIKVPAGSKLLFQMHYTPNGVKQTDRSYCGVCFADKSSVKQLLSGRMAINNRFQIPPQVARHPVSADYHARQDELLVSMTPHMHLRGGSFRYEAFYPNGNSEILLDIPRYDFNWQQKYVLAEPKLLPRGTRIHCSATFDNSAANPFNPDPTATVAWGDQSWEEMMIGFFDTVPPQTSSQ